jgi:enoyl-CoA hydratase
VAEYESLLVDAHDHVAELRLNRPEKLNAFDTTVVLELPTALQQLADDADVRAVVLTSTGRHFSAGGDVDTIITGHGDLPALLRNVDDGRRLFRAFAEFPKPLVVAVHGSTFGVATSLVLTADAVVATEDAVFSDPHVHLGLVAGDGGGITWPLSAGLLRAKRHLLWGEPLSARQAYDAGLVTDLAADVDAVHKVAFELAQRAAALPPVAVQLTKRLLNHTLSARSEELLDLGFGLEALSNRTADVIEAVTAFREKREGRWTGS